MQNFFMSFIKIFMDEGLGASQKWKHIAFHFNITCTCTIIFLGTVAGTIYIDPYARDDKLDRSYYEMGRGKIWIFIF